ncbi:MAG: 50S ribosomal protein L6 [Patescibacteria group bacterium]
MSKIGKKLIEVPKEITIQISDADIVVKSAKGSLSIPILYGVKPKLEGTELSFEVLNNTKQARSNWGTLRSLVNNAVQGLVKDYEKTLILEGVGYRVTKEGDNLTLNLGFSHPVRYAAVPGVVFEVEKNSILKIRGADKMIVGKVAAEIRALKKPEPYKGKGFHYSDEVIRRKAGKKSGTSSS